MNNTLNKERYTCPCCGYKTLEEYPPGTFEICLICYWEDDNVQFENPFYEGGANTTSLYRAQHNFIKYGASEEISMSLVRKPTVTDKRDTHFKLINAPKPWLQMFSICMRIKSLIYLLKPLKY